MFIQIILIDKQILFTSTRNYNFQLTVQIEFLIYETMLLFNVEHVSPGRLVLSNDLK